MDFTTGYAQLGDDRVAYQVIGAGLIDVVLTVGWWGSFDIEWEEPSIRAFYQRLAGSPALSASIASGWGRRIRSRSTRSPHGSH